MIRLAALEEAPTVFVTAGEAGKPLNLPLDHVHEDPDQPRKEFDSVELKKLAASIKKRGVKTPVSVRPYPERPDHFILNFGGRRYRGSTIAGKKTIPAFVDEQHDRFDQVIENTLRDDLKPVELALFFRAQQEAGTKNREIAERLSIDAAAITYHMALLDMPACIEAVYRSGRCTSARTLYDLRKLYEAHSDKVERWAKDREDITRATVQSLAEKVKAQSKAMGAEKPAAKLSKLPVLWVTITQGDEPDALGQVMFDKRPDERSRVWVQIEGRAEQVAATDCRIAAIDMSG